MKLTGKFTIERYVLPNGKKPLSEWLKTQDHIVNARIESRFLKVESGTFGDHEWLGDNIWELKFHFGPGYRVYFAADNKKLILLLLSGGLKKRQKKDISKAKEYYADYIKRSNEYEKAQRKLEHRAIKKTKK